MTDERESDPPEATGDPPGRPGADLVRPFVMTGGRTRASTAVPLKVDTQLMLSPGAEGVGISHESARIVRLCAAGPTSLAELSGRTELPLGVIKVLAGDLVSSGHLQIHHTDKVDIELSTLERLIDRVRAL